MNPNQKLHQVRLNEWAARVSDQKASGLTIPCWCEQNNISVHAYHYWKHQLKQEVLNQMLPDIAPLSFVPVEQAAAVNPVFSNSTNCSIPTNCTSSPKITIVINDASIEIDSSVSGDFLTTVLRAVRHA